MDFNEWVQGPYAERLLKLADFLEDVVPEERWDFSCIFNTKNQLAVEVLPKANDIGFECGSVGCALGWTPKCFPEDLSYIQTPHSQYTITITPKNEQIEFENSFFYNISFQTGAWFFGLKNFEARSIFDAKQLSDVNWPDEPLLHEKSTKEQVAAKIRLFVELKSKGLLEPKE